MSVKQHCYLNLSRASIYRHRANGKRQKFYDALSDDVNGSLSEYNDSHLSENNIGSTGIHNEFDSDSEMDFDASIENFNEDSFSDNNQYVDSDESDVDEFSDAFSSLSESEISEIECDDWDDGIADYDDDYDEVDKFDELLYPGARITVGESLISILKLYLHENMSNSCLSGLLSLIEMHCPGENKCPKTLYFFQKWLGKFEIQLEKCFYCSECGNRLESPDELCESCPEPTSISYFITFPLEKQLEELFKRPGFYNNLRYRFDRQKINDCNYEDIYDGNVYQSFCDKENKNNLRSQSNISLMWNSDGVPLYKSSKFSIWPQYFMINELSPVERKKTCNMLVPGLWFGPKKPNANVFLEPLAENLERIENGIELHVADLNCIKNVLVIPICSTCDLPAKALFLNMKQYNSTFGCHRCTIKTLSVDNRRAYQKVNNLQLRTAAQTQKHAEEALENGSSVFGVKGPTVMSQILPDFIRYTVVDPMHLFMGIGKLLFKIWLFPEYKDHKASISQHFNSIRQQICSIAPPSFVPRLPRRIDDFAYWKASEIILWLLIYSIVVLNGKMSAEYFAHHQMLVHGIYLLSQKSVSQNDINEARRLLRNYVGDFERLYGLKFMSCCVHSLLHLADLVEDYGPSWVFTCFAFENANGILKSLVHATRNAQIQICKGVSLHLMLESLKQKYVQEGSTSALFLEKLEKKGTRRRKVQYVSDGIAIVGCVKKFTTIPQELLDMLVQHGYHQHSIYYFPCLMKDGLFYSSQSYLRATTTNSSCVAYTANGETCIGFVKRFLRVSNCTCVKSFCDLCKNASETLAIIQKVRHYNPFSTRAPMKSIKYIHSLNVENNEQIIVTVSQLKAVYFYISIEETGVKYAIEPFCTHMF